MVTNFCWVTCYLLNLGNKSTHICWIDVGYSIKAQSSNDWLINLSQVGMSVKYTNTKLEKLFFLSTAQLSNSCLHLKEKYLSSDLILTLFGCLWSSILWLEPEATRWRIAEMTKGREKGGTSTIKNILFPNQTWLYLENNHLGYLSSCINQPPWSSSESTRRMKCRSLIRE